MRVWVDVDNPPQVQYLMPLARAFARDGADVTVTARDNGVTFELLEAAGADFHPVGAAFGAKRVAKATGVIRRARALQKLVGRVGRHDIALTGSRPAAIAAWRLQVPAFVIVDYEHSEIGIYRRVGTSILHPDVIGPEPFTQRGFPASRLIPFPGLKEDITFADVDFAGTPEHGFPELADHSLARVLFRPPAEESHYFSSGSRTLALDVLRHLAGRDDVVVVFSPRYAWQAEYLERFGWRVPPVLLRDGVPFVPLLKAVDAVVSSGGTMVREAAYLGITAYSIFQSELGAVDRHLAETGRLVLVRSAEDFRTMRLERSSPMLLPGRNGHVVDYLLRTMRERAATGRN